MKKRFTKVRIACVASTLVVAAVLTAVASGGTGAYFSDSKAGTISGTIGSIKVTTSGGTGPASADLQYTNLLPGVVQNVSVTYQNTGTSNQDVYVKFPNVPALHALNNLGTYGEFHINSSGTPVFDSTNLNDNRPNATGTCGTFSPSGCWPVPTVVLAATAVAPSGSGTISFGFGYASKLSGLGGGVWNSYPAVGSTGADAAGPAGNGLPYEVIAVQAGTPAPA